MRRRLAALRPLRAARRALRFALSARRRRRVGRRWVLERIRHWRRRGQLDRHESAYLRRLSRDEEDGTYLTDFAVHVALKPVYKPLAWLLVPALVQLGWLSPVWLPAALLFGGSVARSTYTLVRVLDAGVHGRRPPWVALAWGALPVVGTAAFPLEILVRGSAGSRAALAALLVYDITTALGRRLPIWGGPDTLTEHRTNRLGDLVIRDRTPLMTPVASSATAAAGRGDRRAV